MLKIRLSRTGAKKNPYYRVVVIEKQNPRHGNFVEILGHYNPARDPAELKLNVERANYWISKGAQPSETVQSLLRKAQQPSESSSVHA